MGKEPEDRFPDALPLAAAALAALALRAFFFNGLTGYDEYAYARIAADISEGVFSLRDAGGYYGFRYLVTLPAAFFYRLFGLGPLAAAAWPLLCSVGNVLLAYALTREWFGRRAGLLAACFQAALPVSAVYGSMLYPDEILVFCTGLSALLFLRGTAAPGPRRAAALLALSGLCAGLGWHARLNSAVMTLVFGAWAWRLGPRPAHLAFAGGFLGALAPEWAANLALTGDFLFGLRSQLAKLAADTAVYPGGHFVYLRGLLGLDLYGLALFGFYFHVFAAAVFYAWHKKRLGALWLPLAWFLVLFLYFEFGPASLDPYRPVHKQLRFLSAAFPPVLAVAAGFAAGLRPAFCRAVTALLLLSSAAAVWRMNAYRLREAEPYRIAAVWLLERSPSAVYASGAWANALGYYLRGLHGEPYYRPGGAGEGSVRPLESAAAAPPGTCLAAEPGEARALPAGLLRPGGDRLELPGGAVVYCFR